MPLGEDIKICEGDAVRIHPVYKNYKFEKLKHDAIYFVEVVDKFNGRVNTLRRENGTLVQLNMDKHYFEHVTEEKQMKQSKPGEWVEPYEGMRIKFLGEKLPVDCSYDTTYELKADVGGSGDFYIVDDAGDYNFAVEGRECWEHYGVVVVEDDQPSAKLNDIVSVSVAEAAPIKSDGGSSAYYQKQIIRLVDGAVFECQTGDIIRSMVANDFDGGNILKALDRIFQNIQGKGKDGVSIEYDCNKIIYFAEIIKQRYAGK